MVQVSHPGIDTILKNMDRVDDCYSITFHEGGHRFVAWTLPNGGRTVVLDTTTGEWHERESRIGTVSIGRWRPAFIIEAYGKQVVGDSKSGKIGVLDADTFEEFGEPQVMSWAYPNIYAPGRGASHRELILEIAAGRGPAAGQGSDPLLSLYVSDDGGSTFRARPFGKLGKIGEYNRRVRFFNLGLSTNRVYRCEVSDPIPLMVVNTNVVADGAYL